MYVNQKQQSWIPVHRRSELSIDDPVKSSVYPIPIRLIPLNATGLLTPGPDVCVSMHAHV